jgi:hypothetical protein
MDQQQVQTGTPQAGGSTQLPAGFTVDSTPYQPQPSAGQPASGLPAGYTVDSTPQPAPHQTAIQKVTSGLEGDKGSDWESPVLGQGISGAIKSGAGGLGNILDMLNHPSRTAISVGNEKPEDEVMVRNAANSYRKAHPDATHEQVQAFIQQYVQAPVSSHIQDAANWLRSGGEPTGFWQKVGAVGEQALEWIGTDGISKMASAPAKAAEVGKAVEAVDTVGHAKQTSMIAQVLKSNPKLAGLVAMGLKAGKDALTMGTGNAVQTLVHTEDPNQAASAGITGGLTAGVLSGVGSGISALASKGGSAASDIAELGQTAANAPTGAEVNNQLADSVNQTVAPELQSAQYALTEAEGGLANAAQSPRDLGVGAPESAAITAQAQKAAKDAYEQLGTNYEKASNAIKTKLAGVNRDFNGSALQKAAQDIMGTAEATKDPIGETLSIANPASAKVTSQLQKLADPASELAVDEDGNSQQLTADKLLGYAKQIKENLRGTGWATDEQRADRDVYHKLLDGVHADLEDLANKHVQANPTENAQAEQGVLGAVQKMNSDYKAGIARFKNTDVQALLKGGDNDVAGRLMRGGTSVSDINTVRDAIGKQAFGKLADSSLQRMAADAVDATTGDFSFKKFLSNWNRIPPATRSAMFQDSTKSGALEQALYQTQAINKSGVIPEMTQKLKDVNTTVSQLLGNGDVSTLLKDPERVTNLSQTLGPDGMQSLGTSILQNQLREASTDVAGKVKTPDTGKVLDFIKSLKDSPEVVDALFKPTPQAEQAYTKLIGQLQNVQSVKNAIKAGIIAPTIAGAIGSGPIGHIIGGILTAGELGTATGRAVLEHIANSPNNWATLRAIDNTVKSPLAKTAGRVLQYGGMKAASGSSQQDVLNSTSDVLGGR